MPRFAQDIRPLFRDKDVVEMRFAFDLSQYDEVKSNAQAIYDRLVDGSCRATAHGRKTESRRFVSGWRRATSPSPLRVALAALKTFV